MESTLKQVKTEFRFEQVAAAPGGMPDGPSSTTTSPSSAEGASYYASILARGSDLAASVRGRAQEVLDAAWVKVASTKVKVAETVAGVKVAVEGTFESTLSKAKDLYTQKVAAPIQGYYAGAQKVVADARAAGATYLKAFTANYDSFKQKGARAWVSETSAAASSALGDATAGAKAKATEAADSAKAKAVAAAEDAKRRAQEAVATAQEAAKQAGAKAVELRGKAGELAGEKSFQATAASAAGGAMALGAGGAATGLAAGGVAGAAAGLPLALFTFGLSIPVGAAVGGGCGLAAGAAAGAGLGAVGGGAAGYGAYAKKDDICGAATAAITKASDGVDFVKGKAYASVGYVKGAAVATRARVFRAGTGSTEGMD